MATKSVGTLSAKLVLDTRGWVAGFQQGRKEAQSFGGVMATKVGGAVTRAGLSLLAFQKVSQGVRKAIIITAKTFAAIEKDFKLTNQAEDARRAEAATKRFGLALSTVDAEKVAEANRSFREMAAVLTGIGRKLVVELAPALSTLLKATITRMEQWSRVASSLGITWDSVGDVFVAAGAVIVTTLDVIGGKIQEQIAYAKILGRTLTAAAQLSAGNATGAAASAALAFAATGDVMAAREKVALAASGKSAADFILSATAARTAGGGRVAGGVGETKTQAAVERGSLEAAKVVAGLGGDPIRVLSDTAAKQLAALEVIKGEIKGQRRDVKLVAARL